MMVLSKQEILLLRIAIKHNGEIYISAITPHYGITIKESAGAFKSLAGMGFLFLSDDVIKITELGNEWINKNQNLFAFSGERIWRQVPGRFLSTQVPPNTPYAPRRSLLARKAASLDKSAGASKI